jgi:hypothetical protein
MPDPIADPEMPTMAVPARCDERNAGSFVAKGWDVDTGRPMFTSPIGQGGAAELSVAACTGVLLVVYNGDTGVIESGKIIRRDSETAFAFGTDREEVRRKAIEAMETRLKEILEVCRADPDGPCPICDPHVPEDAHIDPAECHYECALANIVGHYGTLVDAEFWVDNMHDPYGGLGARRSALAVAKLVADHGLYAVTTGDFPKEPSGASDG